MFSPVTTIAGGIVVDIANRRYRAAENIAARLETLYKGDAAARIRLLVSEHPNGIEEATLISQTGLQTVPSVPGIEKAGRSLILADRISEIRRAVTEAVRQFHKDQPLQPGIPKQDLKARVLPKATPELFDYVLAGVPSIVAEGDAVRTTSHRVALKADEEEARNAIEAAFIAAGLAAPALADVLKVSGIEPSRARTILQILLREGRLVKIADDFVLSAAAIASLKEFLMKKRGQRFTVPEFKEWTGVSRKYAIPLLEYLDRQRITRREGDQRVIL